MKTDNYSPSAISYAPIIGLEIHVELSTKTKMFCRCSADHFGKEPNTQTCPVCLGLPGALPYPNKAAIENCIKIARALNCHINLESHFERKNYFYPDLPKGFQISQYLHPFGQNGYLDIKVPPHPNPLPQGEREIGEGDKKRIRIRRVHMEEDTGKNIHTTVNGKKVSLLDFNRSGVPLVEIVTEPDIHSGEEAKAFLTELQKIVRYLGVSDADMEKGGMRLEPNVSLKPLSLRGTEGDEAISRDRHGRLGRPRDDNLPNYKVEVKNINSFRFVERAIEFETKRQAELLDKGEIPAQETRGWNENRNQTISQRSKEEAHDYRYFPEPDIPPIHFEQSEIDDLQAEIPELPIQKTDRYVKEYTLPYYDAEILTREKAIADYFEEAVKIGSVILGSEATPETDKDPGQGTYRMFTFQARMTNIKAISKQISNYIINKKVDTEKTVPAELVAMIKQASQKTQIDPKKLQEVVEKVLSQNPKVVEDYKSGKVQVIGFLIGQTKKQLPEAVASQIKTIIESRLK